MGSVSREQSLSQEAKMLLGLFLIIFVLLDHPFVEAQLPWQGLSLWKGGCDPACKQGRTYCCTKIMGPSNTWKECELCCKDSHCSGRLISGTTNVRIPLLLNQLMMTMK